MSVKFLAEGDWKWGGSVTWAQGHGHDTEADPSGGWQWGGAGDSTITPGPCPDTVVCCPGLTMPDTITVHVHPDLSTSCSIGGDVDLDCVRNDADPDCPPFNSCWVYSGAIGACMTKLLLLCEPGGSWAWLVICPGCGDGSTLEGAFSMFDCGPPLRLSGGTGHDNCGFDDCTFLVSVGTL